MPHFRACREIPKKGQVARGHSTQEWLIWLHLHFNSGLRQAFHSAI